MQSYGFQHHGGDGVYHHPLGYLQENINLLPIAPSDQNSKIVDEGIHPWLTARIISFCLITKVWEQNSHCQRPRVD